MIIIYFIIDFVVMNLLPINTYFFVIDIDRNKSFYVVAVGIILDLLYSKLLFNVILLYCFYYVVRRLNIKKKYRFLKNIIFYLLFFIMGIYL